MMTTDIWMRRGSIPVLCIWILMVSCAPEPRGTTYDYSCRKVTERSGATSWIFEGKHRPPLELDGGSGFVVSVNRALQAAGLPGVVGAVPERSSITGFRGDRGRYQWKRYAKGPLTVARSLCTDVRYQHYDCIWKVTVEEVP